MKVVIPTILRNLKLRSSDAAPERIRRRAVTFVPERDGTVIVDERRRPRAPQALAARVPA
jgi:hypothetical protein